MTVRPKIEYYFSFVSLWSYIGSRPFQQLAQKHNAEVIYKPIDLMHVFSASGGLPVKQRPLQRQAYRLVEMQRWSAIRNVPIAPHPKYYPADASLAHRVLLVAISQAGRDSPAVHEFARRGLSVVWAEEEDIADPETIVRVATEAGLEGARLIVAAGAPEIVEEESALTREAVSRQVFGAPFYYYRDEPFWGQDRLEVLDNVLAEGREPLVLSDYATGRSPKSYLGVRPPK